MARRARHEGERTRDGPVFRTEQTARGRLSSLTPAEAGEESGGRAVAVLERDAGGAPERPGEGRERHAAGRAVLRHDRRAGLALGDVGEERDERAVVVRRLDDLDVAVRLDADGDVGLVVGEADDDARPVADHGDRRGVEPDLLAVEQVLHGDVAGVHDRGEHLRREAAGDDRPRVGHQHRPPVHEVHEPHGLAVHGERLGERLLHGGLVHVDRRHDEDRLDPLGVDRVPAVEALRRHEAGRDELLDDGGELPVLDEVGAVLHADDRQSHQVRADRDDRLHALGQGRLDRRRVGAVLGDERVERAVARVVPELDDVLDVADDREHASVLVGEHEQLVVLAVLREVLAEGVVGLAVVLGVEVRREGADRLGEPGEDGEGGLAPAGGVHLGSVSMGGRSMAPQIVVRLSVSGLLLRFLDSHSHRSVVFASFPDRELRLLFTL